MFINRRFRMAANIAAARAAAVNLKDPWLGKAWIASSVRSSRAGWCVVQTDDSVAAKDKI